MKNVVFNKQKIGNKIRELQLVNNYSDDYMLLNIDTNKDHYLDILNGISLPKLEEIIKLSNIFNTSIDDLLFYEIK